MCFIKCNKIFNEKLKAQAIQFLLVCQNGLWKGRCCIDALFIMKVHTEKGRYNLETRLACLVWKHLTGLKETNHWNLQGNNIPNLLIRNVIKIYAGNKSKGKQQIIRSSHS